MAGGFYKPLLFELVLQIGEGGFDAGVVDQILVALLVAGVVVRTVAPTIRDPRADKRRPENHDAPRDQRRDTQNAQRQKPPFVEISADMLAPANRIAPAPRGIDPLSCPTLRPLVRKTNGASQGSRRPNAHFSSDRCCCRHWTL